jgi:hypothetical protein
VPLLWAVGCFYGEQMSDFSCSAFIYTIKVGIAVNVLAFVIVWLVLH